MGDSAHSQAGLSTFSCRPVGNYAGWSLSNLEPGNGFSQSPPLDKTCRHCTICPDDVVQATNFVIRKPVRW